MPPRTVALPSSRPAERAFRRASKFVERPVCRHQPRGAAERIPRSVRARPARDARRRGVTPLVRTSFVIAQSAVKPEIRGVIWDLRRRGVHCRYSPLDTGSSAPSHFDWAWLQTSLGVDFADAELLSRRGGIVSFKAKVPLVAVLSPHLFSLSAGYAGVVARVGSFAESGLYTAHACRLGGANGAPRALSVSVRPAVADPAPRRPGVSAAHQ